VVALIVALGGGAFAATQSAKKPAKGLTKAQVIALIKANAGAGPAGAPGPQGLPGAAGAKGDAGAQGEKGLKGDKGTDGTNGTNGSPGKSAKVTPVPLLDAKCAGLGGAVVEVEATPGTEAEVCNGKEGSPWTAGGVLPSGSTETGAWAFNATTEDSEVVAPISIPIRLASQLGEENVHFQGQTEFATNCTGSVLQPKAASEHLCVYYGTPGAPTNATFEFFTDLSFANFGASVSGTLMHFSVSGSAHGFGSWAVTG
jgi:hypothetical protein